MATKKAKPEPGRNEIIVPSTKLSLTPAPIVETERQTINVPVPQEFAEGEEVSTLSPMVRFDENTKPGQYVTGTYQGAKEVTVEGRKARIYMLDDGAGGSVGVWGSTALDNQFDFGSPKPKVGDKILIQFLGTTDTGKGNPAKLFRVKIAR